MKNESLRRYWLTGWMLGLEIVLLFALADGLVIAWKTGIIDGGEAFAFLAGYLLICAGTMAPAYYYCSKVSLPSTAEDFTEYLRTQLAETAKERIKVNQTRLYRD